MLRTGRNAWRVISLARTLARHDALFPLEHLDLPRWTIWMSERLAQLYDGLCEIIKAWQPDTAAVEDIFVNRNPATTLKLGLARGVVLLAPAKAGLDVAEYSTTLIKKSVVGTGHATKKQVGMMVATLLPGARPETEDAADALAVAICHAHHRATWQRWTDGATKEARL